MTPPKQTLITYSLFLDYLKHENSWAHICVKMQNNH